MLDLIALPLGIIIGLLGSLTGIGGGFLLMPILLILFPHKSLVTLTSMSMTLVLFNALSASAHALARKRIDWRFVLPYALFCIPSGLAGLWVQSYLDPEPFRKIFGAFVLASAVFVLWSQFALATRSGCSEVSKKQYYFGSFACILIGFISNFFGVGGGFLFMPLFIYVLQRPLKQALASSQVILLVVSLTSLLTGIISGNFALETQFLALLLLGVLGGAQVGSALVDFIHSKVVMFVLAGLMILAGFRMFY